jgi:hypothetical protein
MYDVFLHDMFPRPLPFTPDSTTDKTAAALIKTFTFSPSTPQPEVSELMRAGFFVRDLSDILVPCVQRSSTVREVGGVHYSTHEGVHTNDTLAQGVQMALCRASETRRVPRLTDKKNSGQADADNATHLFLHVPFLSSKLATTCRSFFEMLRREDASLLPLLDSDDLSSSVSTMQPMHIELALGYIRWLLRIELKLPSTVLTKDVWREIYKQLTICMETSTKDDCVATASATQVRRCSKSSQCSQFILILTCRFPLPALGTQPPVRDQKVRRSTVATQASATKACNPLAAANDHL